MSLVLIVPGRCEYLVFKQVLGREFPGVVRQVVDVRSDSNVIRDAVRIVDRFRNQEDTPIFVRDLDEFPCRSALRAAFHPSIPRPDIVISYISLEAWYLADDEAINTQFTRLAKRYQAPRDADRIGDPQGEIKRLLRDNGNPKGSQYEKTAFATSFARHFSIQRAAGSSSSAARFLRRLEQP